MHEDVIRVKNWSCC